MIKIADEEITSLNSLNLNKWQNVFSGELLN